VAPEALARGNPTSRAAELKRPASHSVLNIPNRPQTAASIRSHKSAHTPPLSHNTFKKTRVDSKGLKPHAPPEHLAARATLIAVVWNDSEKGQFSRRRTQIDTAPSVAPTKASRALAASRRLGADWDLRGAKRRRMVAQGGATGGTLGRVHTTSRSPEGATETSSDSFAPAGLDPFGAATQRSPSRLHPGLQSRAASRLANPLRVVRHEKIFAHRKQLEPQQCRQIICSSICVPLRRCVFHRRPAATAISQRKNARPKK